MSLTQQAAPELGHVFPVSCPYANTATATGKPCDKVGVKACSNCYLVLYCSKECQKHHWKQHKADCKSKLGNPAWRPSWEAEQRVPDFSEGSSDPEATPVVGKFLWGNMPAVDVLKLEHNEGVNYDKDINLLFAASGDVRNAVKTIADIPLTSRSNITAVLNDYDFDIVARNAIILLTALHVEPASTASAVMLYTWHSVLIPSSVLQILHTKVLPPIRDVCNKIADKPMDRLLGKTFTQGSCSVRLVLEKRHWLALQRYMDVPAGLTAKEVQQTRAATFMSEKRKDSIDRAMFCQPIGWRRAMMRFREDGLLVPFGAAREVFDTPNPTFLPINDVWETNEEEFPMTGWMLDDILRSTPLAKNDLYGGMFFHVREVLIRFYKQLRMRTVSLVLLHKNAADLPKTLAKDFHLTHSFDQIEVSNISDGWYVGLKCLHIFDPLLRPLSENPSATLLTLFMNCIHEVTNGDDLMEDAARETGRVCEYLGDPPVPHPNAPWLALASSADLMRVRAGLRFFQDFDLLFERYMEMCSFETVARDARVRAKKKNTIIEPWPLALKKDASKREFEMMLASGHFGAERYVEWQGLH